MKTNIVKNNIFAIFIQPDFLKAVCAVFYGDNFYILFIVYYLFMIYYYCYVKDCVYINYMYMDGRSNFEGVGHHKTGNNRPL